MSYLTDGTNCECIRLDLRLNRRYWCKLRLLQGPLPNPLLCRCRTRKRVRLILSACFHPRLGTGSDRQDQVIWEMCTQMLLVPQALLRDRGKMGRPLEYSKNLIDSLWPFNWDDKTIPNLQFQVLSPYYTHKMSPWKGHVWAAHALLLGLPAVPWPPRLAGMPLRFVMDWTHRLDTSIVQEGSWSKTKCGLVISPPSVHA